MIQTYLTFLAAFLLSGMAAYYSVLGLALIFAGAFWPVVFMGSSLEFAKLVSASWLYRNWKTAPLLIKSYLTFAVVVLMLLTSMGIFGFLAKSHIDSTLDAGANTVELKTLNIQQKNAEERLNYLLARAKDPSTASNRLDRQIQDTQKELSDINKKRLPLLKEENKLTADVGPIKYVADMFFEGDNALDKAVRMVIFIIMLVFDPLAVLLLIAGNISLKQTKETDETPPPKKSWKELFKKDPVPDDMVEVEKENIVKIEEEVKPAPRVEHHAPGVYSEHHDDTVKNISSYDDDAEFAFKQREKNKTDAGQF
jgi:hypothetical protein